MRANKANKKHLRYGILLLGLFWPSVRKKCYIHRVIEKKVFKFEITRAMKGGFISEGYLNFCPIIKKSVYAQLFHYSLISIRDSFFLEWDQTASTRWT